MKIRPTKRLILVLSALLAVGVVLFFFPSARSTALYLEGVIAFILFIDLIWAWFIPPPEIRRELPQVLALGEKCDVTIHLTCRRKRGNILLFDHIPPYFKASQRVLRFSLRKKGAPQRYRFSYQVIPQRRGLYKFKGVTCETTTVMGFWFRKHFIEEYASLKVYPNFKAVGRLASRSIQGKTDLSGVRTQRRRGQGLDFMSHREYQQGDPVRFIDWKASSRRGKPILKEFQEEQDQQVIFLLDSGYRLNQQDKGFTQFDYALDASLFLSYVALKHQDSVGMATFGSQNLWIPPKKGLSQMNVLLNNLYDVHSASIASSPASAMEGLLKRLKRRSLIILLTNLREEDDETLSWILPLISKRHLLLIISFREKEVDQLMQEDLDSFSSSLTHASAFYYAQSRENIRQKWENNGILTINTPPEKLSADLVNQYLMLKGSGKF